jgi:predicted metal-binding protein
MKSEKVPTRRRRLDGVDENQEICSLGDRLKERDTLKEMRLLSMKYGFDEMLAIDTSDVCVAEWVQLKCKYGCRKYGSSWCCPPETPPPDQTRALLNEYRKALLLIVSTQKVEFYRENHQKRRKQVNMWKGAVALERQLFLLGYYKAFALVSENCALCKECAYPEECRFPTDRRPSIESLSIDVFQTLKNVGRPFAIAKAVVEEHNSYSIILLE